jgi:hypothetical protein
MAAIPSPKARVAAAAPWTPRTIRFSNETPVLGLPLAGGKSRPHCSTDGMEFLDLSWGSATSDASAAPDLYRISPDGEVRELLRKLPPNFSNVSVRDFFAGDRTVVTLLEAVNRDDGTEASPPREKEYFLSTSDHDGDLNSLVQMDVRFKPVRIARFGAGDFVVLGWDEGNLLPMLALLKEDGTIRRFVDMDSRRPDAAHVAHASEPGNETASAEQTHATLDSLQDAAFVAYGSELLLTYPGTNKPVHALSAVGEGRSIPIALPGGYVLHDVLASDSHGVLVVRARAVEDPAKAATGGAAQEPQMRLFEVSAYTGALLRELVFAKPRVSEVTCAANSSLTAIFYDTVAHADRDAANAGTTDDATQLVISTVRR